MQVNMQNLLHTSKDTKGPVLHFQFSCLNAKKLFHYALPNILGLSDRQVRMILIAHVTLPEPPLLVSQVWIIINWYIISLNAFIGKKDIHILRRK